MPSRDSIERALRNVLDEFETSSGPREIEVYVNGVLCIGVLPDGTNDVLEAADVLLNNSPDEEGEEDYLEPRYER